MYAMRIYSFVIFSYWPSLRAGMLCIMLYARRKTTSDCWNSHQSYWRTGNYGLLFCHTPSTFVTIPLESPSKYTAVLKTSTRIIWGVMVYWRVREYEPLYFLFNFIFFESSVFVIVVMVGRRQHYRLAENIMELVTTSSAIICDQIEKVATR